MKADMAGGMAGDFDYAKLQPELVDIDDVTLRHCFDVLRHSWVCRRPCRRGVLRSQGVNPTNMVMMVVRQQQPAKPKVVTFEEFERAIGLAGIDDHTVPAIVDSPDIIVGESLDCLDLDAHFCVLAKIAMAGIEDYDSTDRAGKRE